MCRWHLSPPPLLLYMGGGARADPRVCRCRMCTSFRPRRGCKSLWFWGTREYHIPIIPKSHIC